MTKYILKKRIFAVVFLITVFGFSVLNFRRGYEALGETFGEIIIDGKISQEDVSELEDTITEKFYGRMNFVETYAYIQVLLDKRECNNFAYIKDEAGFLHYASFYREEDTQVFEYAMRVKRLQDYAESKGAKVLFAVPPGKYDREITRFRSGLMVNDPNSLVDEIMVYLNRLGVETLDYRQSMPNQELTYEETFFKTDHHWTVPAAFYATQELVDRIEEEFGEDLDPDDYYTDISNYEQVLYHNEMLGSMGRKTGANFSGMEDFIALWPKFEGEFYRESLRETDDEWIKKEGSYEDVLLEKDVLTRNADIYADSPYGLYMSTIRVFEKVVNKNKPDGCRVLMIRDSYFSPVIAFMAPMCGEIDAIWTLEESEEVDIESYVKENEFDYIIIEIYPYNLNEEAFNFFKEED